MPRRKIIYIFVAVILAGGLVYAGAKPNSR